MLGVVSFLFLTALRVKTFDGWCRPGGDRLAQVEPRDVGVVNLEMSGACYLFIFSLVPASWTSQENDFNIYRLVVVDSRNV